MAKINILILFIALTAITIDALELGRCPYVRVKTDFDLSKINGTWYEHSKYNARALEKCIAVDIGSADGNGEASIQRTTTSKITGLQTGITGRAVPSAPGKLRISIDGIAGILGSETVSILDTDNTSYIVLFSCQEVLFVGHNTYVTILTSRRQPNSDNIATAQDALRNNGLSVRRLGNVDQVNCPNA